MNVFTLPRITKISTDFYQNKEENISNQFQANSKTNIF